jgi:Tol biopolymer transport system component
MAAPHVSGVAALILSRHPEFTAEQVRQALRDGADDLGPAGRDARYGYGRLNAANSVALDAVAVARLTAPTQLSRFHGELITIEGTVQNPGGGVPSWRVLFGPQGQALSELASGTGLVDHGVLASLDTAPLARGNYLVQLEVSGPGGETASDTVAITRLATHAYMRQISDQTGSIALLPQAWSDDSHTLVWGQQPDKGFWDVMAADLTRATRRAVVSYRFGGEFGFPVFAPEPAISGDGRTIAFSAPENLSRSLADDTNRNFQLFVFDPTTNSLEQVTHVTGGQRQCTDFCALSPSRDGTRIAFIGTLALDPSVGNADGSRELFYWDRASNTFHQATSTTGSGFGTALAISADGNRIAFASAADLDPTVGNPRGKAQVFVYDVPSQTIHQLTQVVDAGQVLKELREELAISPDGTQIAAAIDTEQASTFTPLEHELILIDVASGATQSLLTLPLFNINKNEKMQFSTDGTRIVFMFEAPVDRLFVPFAKPFVPLMQYDLRTGAASTLAAFPNDVFSLAVASDGRIAVDSPPAYWGPLDPDGVNRYGIEQIYVVDPSANGGLLWLKRGRLLAARTGPDRFTVRGQLFQPTGGPLDPSSNDVSVTLLGANGQLFRATLPAGTLRRTGGGWRFSNASAADLTSLTLRGSDGVHYTFSAAGRQAGLVAAATPYLAVELQVGEAVFSNAHPFRTRGHTLVYP